MAECSHVAAMKLSAWQPGASSADARRNRSRCSMGPGGSGGHFQPRGQLPGASFPGLVMSSASQTSPGALRFCSRCSFLVPERLPLFLHQLLLPVEGVLLGRGADALRTTDGPGSRLPAGGSIPRPAPCPCGQPEALRQPWLHQSAPFQPPLGVGDPSPDRWSPWAPLTTRPCRA